MATHTVQKNNNSKFSKESVAKRNIGSSKKQFQWTSTILEDLIKSITLLLLLLLLL